MSWQDRIIAAHTSVTNAVGHGVYAKSERYFVWQEDGVNALDADDGQDEGAVTGTTNLYSKKELDPWADALGPALTAQGISWSLVSVDYEEDTRFWHWSWDWEVP